MNLGADRDYQTSSLQKQIFLNSEQCYNRWIEHPTSSIIHHDRDCCKQARLWFLSYARSMEGWSSSQFDLKAPTWLSQLFTWGPSLWPISWCQLVKEKTIDCGVFAALAREIFEAQGHSVHPAQALLSYNKTCTAHWKALWKNKMPSPSDLHHGEVFQWVGDQVVYHEICIIELPNGTAKVYDATFGSWYEPLRRKGFGALLSVRSECPRLLEWGNKVLSCGEWVDL